MVLRFILISWTLSTNFCLAQSLIKDGSFEFYLHCPEDFVKENLNCLKFWKQVGSPTPDYFNICSNYVGIPKNRNGYQMAYHGYGYAGLISYDRILRRYREILSTSINTPLTKDSMYFVKFHAALSNFDALSTSQLKIYFQNGNNYYKTKNLADSVSIKDTMNWTILKSFYVANGGEKNLLVGNMEKSKKIIKVKPKNGNKKVSYYYIDAVYLIKINQSLLTKIRVNDTIIINEKYKSSFNPSDLLIYLNKLDLKNNSQYTQFLENISHWMIENPFIELEILYNSKIFEKEVNVFVNYLLKKKITDLRVRIMPDSNANENIIFNFKSYINKEDIKRL